MVSLVKKSEIDLKNVIYVKPNLRYKPRRLKVYYGLDCETYIDGKPILIAVSDGATFRAEDLPWIFFNRKYRGATFFLYNLRFDAGVLLSWLPREKLKELAETGLTEYRGYIVEYIPHKFMKFRRGRNNVKFYDLLQFYQMSLDKASQLYLNDSKIKIETKHFTKEYVDKHFDEIKEYCVKDAKLTRDLASVLIEYINKFGLEIDRFYSQAYVGVEYLKYKRCARDIYRLYRDIPGVIQAALKAYRGGKFEVVRRGRGYFYQYDIRSAYPHEIAKLYDIEYAKVTHCSKYREDADMGFINARIYIKDDIFHSVSVFDRTLCYYPTGIIQAWITKQEYDYLVSKGISIDIKDAYWIRFERKHLLFKDVIDELYKIKQKYKNVDKMMSHMSKIMINGLYGKMIQLVPSIGELFRAGILFNPIYASHITANVRLRVSEIQNKFRDYIVAVHTDSVILTKNVLDNECGDGLGMWSKENEGDGVMILCGIYQVGDKVATRCYNVNKNMSWLEYLEKAGNSETIEIEETRAVSWIEAVHYGKHNPCEFVTNRKVLNLNRDNKRVWLSKTNARKLLTTLEVSIPRVTFM